jgi:hypothetical protein
LPLLFVHRSWDWSTSTSSTNHLPRLLFVEGRPTKLASPSFRQRTVGIPNSFDIYVFMFSLVLKNRLNREQAEQGRTAWGVECTRTYLAGHRLQCWKSSDPCWFRSCGGVCDADGETAACFREDAPQRRPYERGDLGTKRIFTYASLWHTHTEH